MWEICAHQYICKVTGVLVQGQGQGKSTSDAAAKRAMQVRCMRSSRGAWPSQPLLMPEGLIQALPSLQTQPSSLFPFLALPAKG